MSEPLVPKGADALLATVPAEVEVSEADADLAAALWDRSLPAYAGLLDAEPRE